MSGMNRREALGLIAMAPFAPAVGVPGGTRDHHAADLPERDSATDGAPARQVNFFTAAEIATVGILADMIIPADARSGSASDAGVPEFIDFMMTDTTDASLPGRMRGGLAWVDAEMRRRHAQPFVSAGEAERAALLDDIAWPSTARPEMSHGVAFFSSFRDMVASGFWSSEMGIEDIGYIGNTALPAWTGCPPAVLARLGLDGEGG